MAKYSTGGGGGAGDGAACELCGAAADDLRTATVAGAELQVCDDCAPHSDGGGDERTRDDRETAADRTRKAVQNAARAADYSTAPDGWAQDAPQYDGDQLPYLVPDYADRVVQARQDAGLQREELAEELDVDENSLLAVEQGRATQGNVGGSVIGALERRLGVTLAEEE